MFILLEQLVAVAYISRLYHRSFFMGYESRSYILAPGMERTNGECVAISSNWNSLNPLLYKVSHGYRWTATYIRINEQISISENYAYKCFRFLAIKSETKHQAHYKYTFQVAICQPDEMKNIFFNFYRLAFTIQGNGFPCLFQRCSTNTA